MTEDHSGRLESQGARPVSSEFSQTDPESDADYQDLKAYLSPAVSGGPSAQIEAARRMDARAVLSGQMEFETFRAIWNADPFGILGFRDVGNGAVSLYLGDSASGAGATPNQQTGTALSDTPGAIRVDQEKGVRGSAQHHPSTAG